MKCMNCGQENKDAAKNCKKCSRSLSIPPAWFPDTNWHIRTLSLIYIGLIIVYFGVNFFLGKFPKPYHLRDIAPEMTPWLTSPGKPKHLPEDQLKAPPWDAPAPATPAGRKDS